MEGTPQEETPRISTRQGFKKLLQAGIVAAGALFPSPSANEAPEPQGTEMAEPEDSQEEVSGESTAEDSSSDAETAEEEERTEWENIVSNLSPEEAAANVGNPELSLDQRTVLLDKAMELPLSEEERDALFKDLFIASAGDGNIQDTESATRKLVERGLDPGKTPWLMEHIEWIFLNHPEEFVHDPKRTYRRRDASGVVEDIPSPWLSYNPLRDVAELSQNHLVHTTIEMLDNDYEPETKRRIVFFADEVAEGRMSLEDAAKIAANGEKTIEKLAEIATNNPTDRLLEALYNLATDEQKESLLPKIQNYAQWATDRDIALAEYAEEARKANEEATEHTVESDQYAEPLEKREE